MSSPKVKVPAVSTAKRGLDIAIDTTNSAQQAVPVALMRGTRKLSVTVISTIYNAFTRPTPNDAKGKK